MDDSYVWNTLYTSPNAAMNNGAFINCDSALMSCSLSRGEYHSISSARASRLCTKILHILPLLSNFPEMRRHTLLAVENASGPSHKFHCCHRCVSMATTNLFDKRWIISRWFIAARQRMPLIVFRGAYRYLVNTTVFRDYISDIGLIIIKKLTTTICWIKKLIPINLSRV